MTAYDMDFIDLIEAKRFTDFPFDLIKRQRISVGGTRIAGKSAEFAKFTELRQKPLKTINNLNTVLKKIIGKITPSNFSKEPNQTQKQTIKKELQKYENHRHSK